MPLAGCLASLAYGLHGQSLRAKNESPAWWVGFLKSKGKIGKRAADRLSDENWSGVAMALPRGALGAVECNITYIIGRNGL